MKGKYENQHCAPHVLHCTVNRHDISTVAPPDEAIARSHNLPTNECSYTSSNATAHFSALSRTDERADALAIFPPNPTAVALAYAISDSAAHAGAKCDADSESY